MSWVMPKKENIENYSLHSIVLDAFDRNKNVNESVRNLQN
jgi:hypothetical protein